MIDRHLCGSPLLSPGIRWRMARSELLYGKITRLRKNELTEPAGLELIARVTHFWRKLFVEDAGAPTDTDTPTLHYLDKVAACVVRRRNVEDTNEYHSLDSDLRQIRFGVEIAIARLLSVKPGGLIVCATHFADGIKFRVWRIEKLDRLCALTNYAQENEMHHLGIAWAYHPALCVEVPMGDIWRYRLSLPWLDTRPASSRAVANEIPVSMSLSQHCQEEELYGWIDWEICAGEQNFEISLSNVYPPLDDIWLWTMLISASCLPVAVHIDMEGTVVTLRASWAELEADRIFVSIAERAEDNIEKPVAVIGRRNWLQLMGQTYGDFFAGVFVLRLWDYDEDRIDRPESLPWDAPEKSLHAGASVFSEQQELALAMLRLAKWSGQGRAGFDLSNPRAIGRHYVFCQRTALVWGVVALLAGHNKLPQTWHGTKMLDSWLDELPASLSSAVSHALDAAVKCQAEWYSDDPRLAYRYPSMSNMAAVAWAALHAISEAVTAGLPLQRGMWLLSSEGRWGQVLKWVEPSAIIIVDWGEYGIECVDFTRSGCHLQSPPHPAPVFPDAPLWWRWRRFATDENSGGYLICPCCGYPSGEMDPIEIEFCLYCGWDGNFGYRLQEPNKPTELGDRTYTLRQARQNVEAHGDAFASDDASQDALTHRLPEIVAAKRKAIAEMDAWLATEPDSTEFPDEGWAMLDDLLWQARQKEMQ